MSPQLGAASGRQSFAGLPLQEAAGLPSNCMASQSPAVLFHPWHLLPCLALHGAAALLSCSLPWQVVGAGDHFLAPPSIKIPVIPFAKLEAQVGG